ncbi:MAG: hypothetical protein U0R66_10480 [Mycobacterium sp.]
MTTWLIVGGLVLLAVGLVSSQLFRLKDWLSHQPNIPNPEPEGHSPDRHTEPGQPPEPS